jgi:predicted kinase
MKHVYLLCGPSLAGKTVFRDQMVAALGLRSISFDEINRERGIAFGADALQHEWAATMELARRRLDELLAAGCSVVVDDTFCYRWLRERFCVLSRRSGATPLIVYFAVEPAILHERYEAIRASNERPLLPRSVFGEHLRTFEAPTGDELVLRFSTPEAGSEWLRREAAGLSRRDLN